MRTLPVLLLSTLLAISVAGCGSGLSEAQIRTIVEEHASSLEPGPQGPTGVQGPQGIQGKPGPQGPVGKQSERGEKGDAGIQGILALKGSKGNRGSQGQRAMTASGGHKDQCDRKVALASRLLTHRPCLRLDLAHPRLHQRPSPAPNIVSSGPLRRARTS